ncbi:MAG: VacB/RNase II family 3'-5' exoribonuclease [Victivallales bacterium]|nr:VacB/RNase II family 3'-5' exoribonuclease [Victivallales bacterium]
MTGVFHRNPKGFGFVSVERPGCHGVPNEDVFIQIGHTQGALTGDRVSVSVYRERDARGPSGEITGILERARPEIVGVLAEDEWGNPIVRPLRRDLPAALYVQGETAAHQGDWVQVRLIEQKDGSSQLPLVAVLSRVGRMGTVSADLKAICEDFDIPCKYTAASERHAESIVPVEVPREDCRQLEVFTCDPMDARDYDDAISLEICGKVATLGVHIADVACYVPHGSALDRSARGRGFTSYLPGRTIGMLPDALSADLCSLRQGVDRLAHSVFLQVEVNSGKVLSSRRVHTIIHSAHRLCYEQVDRVLAGERLPELSGQFCAKLKKLDKLARQMRSWRQARECFLPLEVPEIRVLCGGKPLRVMGLQQGHSGPSSEMIEEFMLAANVAVAEEMKGKSLPGLYRNHAEPTEEALHQFSALAQELGLKKVKHTDRSTLARVLAQLREKTGGELVSIGFLRKMPRAEYSLSCIGHYGLGKPVYCHFTSPIRRYADLLVHQQLLALDMGRKTMQESAIAPIAESCNALEYNIDQACFAASDRLKLRLMQERRKDKALEPLDAWVCRVQSAQVTIYIPEYGLMSSVEPEGLPSGKWLSMEGGSVLKNCRTGQKLRFGTPLKVLPRSIDLVRGVASFAVAAAERSPRRLE